MVLGGSGSLYPGDLALFISGTLSISGAFSVGDNTASASLMSLDVDGVAGAPINNRTIFVCKLPFNCFQQSNPKSS